MHPGTYDLDYDLQYGYWKFNFGATDFLKSINGTLGNDSTLLC